MAITVTWVEWHGTDTPATTVGEETTNINLGDADTVDITPADSPVKVGERSYFKQGKFNFSGSMTQIDNVRVYKSAGDYVTGEDIEFNGEGITASTPDKTDQSWGSIPTSQSAANVYLEGSAAGTLLQSDYESSTGMVSGARTDLCGFQLVTTGSTPTGATNTKTISVVYDKQ